MKNSVAIALLALGTIGYAQVKDSVRYEKKIDEVELFGEKKKKEKGMEIITRMPLKVRDQIQSISVISHKAIEDMGALTITDAAKNYLVPMVAVLNLCPSVDIEGHLF
jgi:ferrichrome-iron receptor